MDRRAFLMAVARLAGPGLAMLMFDPSGSAGAGGFDDGLRDAFGARFHRRPGPRHSRRPQAARSWVHHWNAIAIDASGLDHTPVETGEQRVFGENLGPGRSSRAMAIIHIAIFDAVNAIVGGYRSYTGLAPARDGTSMRAAIAQAAHDTLVELSLAAGELRRAARRRPQADSRAQRQGQGHLPGEGGRRRHSRPAHRRRLAAPGASHRCGLHHGK